MSLTYVNKAKASSPYKYDQRVTFNSGGLIFTSTKLPTTDIKEIKQSGVRCNNDVYWNSSGVF